MNQLDQKTLELLAAFSEPQSRKDVATKLARRYGASNFYAFIADAELYGKPMPARGFVATLPGGDGWRDLLDRAKSPGFHHGRVASAHSDELEEATAYTDAELVVVFTGEAIEPSRLREVVVAAPLLRAMLRAEHAEFVAQGQLQVARDEARQSSALATALDGTRAALQSAMADLEEKTRKLERARTKAEESARVKDDFLAMLGHELRNPLAPIFTALEVLKIKKVESDLLDIIRRQAGHLSRLVDDLLDVSRITQGKVVLRKEPVELAAITERAIEMVSPLLDEKRQTLVVDIAERGLEIEADPARFSQILSNLLTNAAKYSPAGSRIELGAESSGGFVRVSVKDEGNGIEDDELERIFEWFAQQDQSASRADGGLGLGLAIVRSLVELHGGTISVHSDGLDEGSEFIVEVPVSTESSEADDLESCEGDHMQQQHPAARVLVVDDNEDAAILLSEALKVVGYQTQVAFDGPSALEMLDDFAPRIVLADIGLPIMDGYELAGHLRKWAADRPLFLVAVTGYGQKKDRVRALDEGFDAHLVKPVDLSAVCELLETVAQPQT